MPWEGGDDDESDDDESDGDDDDDEEEMEAEEGGEPLAPADVDPAGLLEADAAAAPPAAPLEVMPPSKWIGAENVEVQGCEPQNCDMICGDCAWEPCKVLADNLCGQCTVQFADGQEAQGIQYRHLRIIKKSKRHRADQK